VNMREDEKYDYERSDLWTMIQYLPDFLKDKSFYIPEETSSYEKVLAQNLMKIKRVKRTNNLPQLKQKFPK
ncbi:MAG: replication-associated recombination protein A, partial [Longicatena sp.]|nr:replication-associated recombination protein A [Longicatena sp.]